MIALTTIPSRAVCRTVGAVYDARLRRFPRLVRIETTNACNARCVICPHGAMKRPIERMGDELFERIIDECAANDCVEIHMHNFGEPLMDKDLERRVAYAKGRGIPRVKIFCNGSLLDERRARGLLQAGLDELKISFDGATREEFEQIRTPLKFDQVVENVHRVVRLRDEMRRPMRVKVACCSTTDPKATMQTLEKVADGFSFGKIHNWAGGEGPSPESRVRKPCSRLWRTFTILASGEVALCCLDYDGRHVLGRVSAERTIREIWRDQPYDQVRQWHRTGRQENIDLCRNCTKSFL